jgi:cell division protein FtsZ
MPQITSTNTDFARIKVVGVGGGGSNAVDYMINSGLVNSVEFIAVNTDSQALLRSGASTKLQIGSNYTRGLGSGGDPEVGKASALESREQIKDLFYDTDMVFITAGMGGGTGTGATPIIAKEAKAAGSLTVAVVTKPFEFEGKQRMIQAEDGIEELIQHVDAHILVPNENLIKVLDKDITLLNAFKFSDDVLGQGVRGISDLITIPGRINADFADVKNIMVDSGSLLMGLGEASGKDRAKVAAKKAITSPLLELSIEGAKGVVFNITAGEDVKLSEITEAAKIITECADDDATIIFGQTVDKTLGDAIKITVIATGFSEKKDYSHLVSEDMGDDFEVPTFMRAGK